MISLKITFALILSLGLASCSTINIVEVEKPIFKNPIKDTDALIKEHANSIFNCSQRKVVVKGDYIAFRYIDFNGNIYNPRSGNMLGYRSGLRKDPSDYRNLFHQRWNNVCKLNNGIYIKTNSYRHLNAQDIVFSNGNRHFCVKPGGKISGRGQDMLPLFETYITQSHYAPNNSPSYSDGYVRLLSGWNSTVIPNIEDKSTLLLYRQWVEKKNSMFEKEAQSWAGRKKVWVCRIPSVAKDTSKSEFLRTNSEEDLKHGTIKVAPLMRICDSDKFIHVKEWNANYHGGNTTVGLYHQASTDWRHTMWANPKDFMLLDPL